jgi:hypothetical protein
MSERTAEELTLALAAELIYYGANCRACKETRSIDLAALAEKLGGDFLVRDVRPRLRCGKCGARSVIVTTLWKDASSSERLKQHWK